MLDNLFGLGKPRILVADDDPFVSSLVADILIPQGYRVESVPDGQAAVDRLRKTRFDLVILDMHMPKLEGIQVLEFIRLMPGGQALGAIMLTSENATAVFARAYELGVAAYISKPFSPAELLAQVNSYFAAKK